MEAHEYEFHEFANIYRLLEGADFQAMVASIKTGQRNPITLYEGKILDGRNRYKACIAAGVNPEFRTYAGDDPVGEIAALNDIRRHDTMAERALVGARMANLKKGRQSNTANAGFKTPVITIDRAAHLSGATTSMIERAKPIVTKGAPELIKAVESGLTTVYAAEQIAKLPTERQVDIVSKGAEHIKEKAKEIRDYGGEIADAPEPNAEYVAPSEPSKPEKIGKYIPDMTGQFLPVAILHIDRIADNDVGFEKAMKEIIAHCETRLNKRKK